MFTYSFHNYYVCYDNPTNVLTTGVPVISVILKFVCDKFDVLFTFIRIILNKKDMLV